MKDSLKEDYMFNCSVFFNGDIEEDFTKRPEYYSVLFEHKNYSNFKEMKTQEALECLQNNQMQIKIANNGGQ